MNIGTRTWESSFEEELLVVKLGLRRDIVGEASVIASLGVPRINQGAQVWLKDEELFTFRFELKRF